MAAGQSVSSSAVRAFALADEELRVCGVFVQGSQDEIAYTNADFRSSGCHSELASFPIDVEKGGCRRFCVNGKIC